MLVGRIKSEVKLWMGHWVADKSSQECKKVGAVDTFAHHVSQGCRNLPEKNLNYMIWKTGRCCIHHMDQKNYIIQWQNRTLNLRAPPPLGSRQPSDTSITLFMAPLAAFLKCKGRSKKLILNMVLGLVRTFGRKSYFIRVFDTPSTYLQNVSKNTLGTTFHQTLVQPLVSSILFWHQQGVANRFTSKQQQEVEVKETGWRMNVLLR